MNSGRHTSPRQVDQFSKWLLVPPRLWKHLEGDDYEDYFADSLELAWDMLYPWLIYLIGMATGMVIIIALLMRDGIFIQ